MNELSNIDTLTTEILVYKQQTALNIIEIGKRLKQVKEQLSHGEWGNWLKRKVDFSQQTANKFMRCADEFQNYASTRNLPTGHMFELLTLSPEQREEIMQENEIAELSQKKLREIVKAKKDAEKQVEDFKLKAAQLEDERDDLKEEFSHMKENVEQLIKERQRMQVEQAKLEEENQNYKETIEQAGETYQQYAKKLDEKNALIQELSEKIENAKCNTHDDTAVKELTDKLNQAQDEIKILNEKLNQPIEVEPVTVEKVIEKIPEATLTELNELKEKVKSLENNSGSQEDKSIVKYRICFESIKTNFNQLLQTLSELTAGETQDKYKKATISLLKAMETKL